MVNYPHLLALCCAWSGWEGNEHFHMRKVVLQCSTITRWSNVSKLLQMIGLLLVTIWKVIWFHHMQGHLCRLWWSFGQLVAWLQMIWHHSCSEQYHNELQHRLMCLWVQKKNFHFQQHVQSPSWNQSIRIPLRKKMIPCLDYNFHLPFIFHNSEASKIMWEGALIHIVWDTWYIKKWWHIYVSAC